MRSDLLKQKGSLGVGFLARFEVLESYLRLLVFTIEECSLVGV